MTCDICGKEIDLTLKETLGMVYENRNGKPYHAHHKCHLENPNP